MLAVTGIVGHFHEFGPQFLANRELDLFFRRDQFAGGIGFVEIHHQLEGVGHFALVVHPELQGVPLQVELGNEFFPWEPLDAHVVNHGIRRHKRKVSCTQPHAFLLHNHLFGRFFAEKVQFKVRLARQAQSRIFHVEFLELVQAVVKDRMRMEQGIQEGHPLRLGVVQVVVVLVLDGIDPINGVLDIPEAEKTPFVGFGGGNGTLEEHGRIGLVLIQHDGNAF